MTVPIVYYLLQQTPTRTHDHGAHAGEHVEDHEEGDDQESEEESSHDESQQQSGDESENESDKQETLDETGENDEAPDDTEGSDTATDEDNSSAPEVVAEDDQNVTKSYPDAKGGKKKRIESKRGLKLGEVDTSEDDSDMVRFWPASQNLVVDSTPASSCKASWELQYTVWQTRGHFQHRHEAFGGLSRK